MDWDYVTDFLAVGSGASLAGAVAASAAGLDVLVVEKTDEIGGSTAMSAGILWLPNNPLMAREGVPDSREAALAYLGSVVGDAGPASSEARREAFLDRGTEMVLFLEQEGLAFVRCPGYSDYYEGYPGISGARSLGRSIECIATDTRRLGPLEGRLRASGFSSPLIVQTRDAAKLGALTRRAVIPLATSVARSIAGRLRGQHLRANGGALITQLVEVLMRREVPIWTETPFVDVITEGTAVVGAVLRRRGRDYRVRARRGVLIAAGGFAHNNALRRRFSDDPLPADETWSLSNPGDTGEALEAIIARGAATDMLDSAWWIPTVMGPRGAKIFTVPERANPGSIIVDTGGHRYFNEAIAYMEAGQLMFRREREVGGAVPSWLVFDSRYRSKYRFGPMLPGVTPKEWIEGGYLKRAESLSKLAAECGIDPAALAQTVGRFNGFARAGIDQDFHRGVGAHDRYYADPLNKPNACLGEISKPPFYAIQIYPGDVGTAGGLLTDEHARVLSKEGQPIPGLYAAGNVTASVMGRTYPGAGASIAASAVFGYVAAMHVVGDTPGRGRA
jgi:succinate dehydrogenase/fumarate reductase flavoprotein subunit